MSLLIMAHLPVFYIGIIVSFEPYLYDLMSMSHLLSYVRSSVDAKLKCQIWEEYTSTFIIKDKAPS